ncbi:hypothetical protein SK128_005355 [Halocaridina rubra]|uniref:Uncharacterized protein n=1 Tax=Halocaridina rubra TaxID=373956 RepID=A0AAN8XED2_HALRR
MDPWAGVAKEKKNKNISTEDVYSYFRQQRQIAKENETRIVVQRKITYAVKERNYETYNYIHEDVGFNSEDDEEQSDTLSSILVRAMRRKEKRREIEEIRKIKQFEEEKKKIEEEKKQCLEAKRKHGDKLRELREAHQLRVLKEQEWRSREVRIARQNKLVEEFLKKKLLQRYFKQFRSLLVIKRENFIKARNHYRLKIVRKAFAKIVVNRDQELIRRDEMATNFYHICIIKKCFTIWKQMFTQDIRVFSVTPKAMEERRKQLEIAAVHYNALTLRRCVWVWKWWAVDEHLHRRTQIQHAKDHHRRFKIFKAL